MVAFFLISSTRKKGVYEATLDWCEEIWVKCLLRLMFIDRFERRKGRASMSSFQLELVNSEALSLWLGMHEGEVGIQIRDIEGMGKGGDGKDDISIYLYIIISIYLLIYISIYHHIYLSIYLLIYISIYQYIYLSINLYIYISIHKFPFES